MPPRSWTSPTTSSPVPAPRPNWPRAPAPPRPVVAIDAALPAGNEPHLGKLTDIAIMVVVPGRERTEADFHRLFTNAGLRLTRILPTDGWMSVIEAEAA
ncbi:hypothetical protein MOQ72_18075 [Saccharopolyspora sp. K220]|uniref:hypothetical protein n=1 Tax=Saccharopolyspora soli TaxID=2926618 RepID=UPI001F5A7592|nr:hypothetical protein [Saccharopolyspora soli]MCI2419355.1 hypothetical protein [Saccharopolyspora soli]